ncbi:transcription initiation factor TFIID subunit 5 [Drosophila santomea]|uniref:transcription initiation factor TFIID subunit 5 n=1 Tax=Drosophila santomea TaxID=129105 RepID=UPI0019537DC1|nr:transcription initiation factor TFIID subunit 5 [Drosophila santomea]
MDIIIPSSDEVYIISDSDDSRDEIRKELMKLEDSKEKTKNKEHQKSRNESSQTKMNKWYLKEFEDLMGLEIADSDDEVDIDDHKSEKSSSSESDKTTDSDDSNSDGSFTEWINNVKNVNLFAFNKSNEDSQPKACEEVPSMPVFSGPMPSMPIYDAETCQFEMVAPIKEPDIIKDGNEVTMPNESENSDSESEKEKSQPDEEDNLFGSNSSSSLSFSSLLNQTDSDDEDDDSQTDFDEQCSEKKPTYWEEMSLRPVDRGEISQEELMAILKEDGSLADPQKGLNSSDHQSDCDIDEAIKNRDGLDFFEDRAEFPENRENVSLLVIKEDSVFADYELAVKKLIKLIQSAPSHYKYEIYILLYPLMVITYLQMMASEKMQRARMFLIRFQDHLDDSYIPRIMKLRDICKPAEIPNKARKLLAGHEKVKIEMSEGAFRQLLLCSEDWSRGQQEKLLSHFQIQSYSEDDKPQQRFATGQPHLAPICYGAPEPLNKKDFAARPFFQKRRRKRNEPQALKNLHLPPVNRVFNPNPKRMDLLHMKNDEQHRMKLDRDNLPSTYLYTTSPSDEVVICANFSEGISMLALGTVSSKVYVFSLKPSKLVQVKAAQWLKVLDTNMAGVDKGMLDPTKKYTRRTLYGHQGPVYGCSFNPEDRFLLTCSEDFSVRLWCLLSWSCVVIFPGHLSPVCFVVYAPRGYYFATASDDCMARVWMQDNRKPARVLQGHLAELGVCLFHPNRHYIATGSADCTVRIWDIVRALQVRLFRGHKDRITALTYSICGRYLVSGGDDNLIMIWDTANEILMQFFDHHKASINTMEIALDNNLLVVGGQDCQLTVWDFEQVIKNYLGRAKASRMKNQAESQESSVKHLLVGSFRSKGAPFYMIRFTRRNLLLGFCVAPRGSENDVLDVKPNQPKVEKKKELCEWLDFLDLIKWKAYLDLKDEIHLDTSQAEKENKP